MSAQRPTAFKGTMPHGKTWISTEMFASAITSVVQCLAPLQKFVRRTDSHLCATCKPIDLSGCYPTFFLIGNVKRGHCKAHQSQPQHLKAAKNASVLHKKMPSLDLCVGPVSDLELHH
jgi:hypothetical protein